MLSGCSWAFILELLCYCCTSEERTQRICWTDLLWQQPGHAKEFGSFCLQWSWRNWHGRIQATAFPLSERTHRGSKFVVAPVLLHCGAHCWWCASSRCASSLSRAKASIPCLGVRLQLLQPCCLIPLQKTDNNLPFFLSSEFEQINFFFVSANTVIRGR